jgi:hypothetical protein
MIAVTNVIPLVGYLLRLEFSDGASGIADLSDIPRTGVFAPWADSEFFRLVRIDEESGTLLWPGEIDLDPYVLYSRSTGKPIEEALDLV